MNNIFVLDQTLREGGYVYNFKFGKNNINTIISRLVNASVDFIECGFIRKERISPDYTIFSDLEQISSLFEGETFHPIPVAMLEVNEHFQYQSLELSHKAPVGIRVSFHFQELNEAIQISKFLISQGHMVFLQPIGFSTFSIDVIYKLIDASNEIKPYAFYIVDTLGQMLTRDIYDAVTIIDSKLSSDIVLGFHSHNNSQMSFSNALSIINYSSNRDIIIDSSIKGLGRGAGTIKTEMITHYLNKSKGANYNMPPILSLLDECFLCPVNMASSQDNVAYYYAATLGCHPNYAAYLLNIKRLSLNDVYNILNKIDNTEKAIFRENYIKKLTI